jgi:hypothetical protein
MYKWLAKALFTGWLITMGYNGIAGQTSEEMPVIPSSNIAALTSPLPDRSMGEGLRLPNAREIARGTEDIANEAKKQVEKEEFRSLVGDTVAVLMYAWDKATLAMYSSFAPGVKPPKAPSRAQDEVTITKAVTDLKTTIVEAADVAIEISRVVGARHPEDTTMPTQAPGEAPREPRGMIRDYPGRNR